MSDTEPLVPEGWTLHGGKLRRHFVFVDFSAAWAFMTRVALLAERLDHHPDWSNSWNRVTIELISHDRGSITDRDRTMATRINILLE